MSRRTRIILLAVVGLIAASSAVGFYFHETDSKFRYWWGLPVENRLLSIKLEIKRPFLKLFSEINPSSYDELNLDSLKSSVQSGASWILRMQEESGRFNYWYNPEEGTFSKKSDDNFLRQAGTNYSLLSAFEISGDSSLLQGALLNLSYLNRFIKNPHPDTAYYLYRGKAKLGGIALPMLAMLKLRSLTQDTTYDQSLKALGNMILKLQELYGTGQFKSTYVYNGDYHYEKNRGWESNIYPGEAMLAMVEMYRTFRDERYLTSLSQATDFYSQDSNWRHFSFMPWATIAQSRLAIITGESKYAEFAIRMSDRILYWQNIDRSDEVYGSLFGVPTVFTATWMEGIGSSLKLLRHLGESEKEQQYFNQLMISYKWLLQLQYSKSDLMENGYSNDALGGFRRSLIEPEIRIDNTQHAISSIIKVITYLES